MIIWPYLNQFITADTSPWVLLDSRYNGQYGGAMWFDRVQLNVRSEIDPGNDANVWKGRAGSPRASTIGASPRWAA